MGGGGLSVRWRACLTGGGPVCRVAGRSDWWRACLTGGGPVGMVPAAETIKSGAESRT
jgi:hypothetical protein